MPYGKRINRKTGEKLLTKEIDIARPVKGHLELILSTPALKEHKNYFCKNTNVFIFDVSLIKDLIKYKESSIDKEAAYLAVILGAQDMDGTDTTDQRFEKGDRTIMIVACNMDGKDLKSIPGLEPAVEHPPRRSEITFPIEKEKMEGAINIKLL